MHIYRTFIKLLFFHDCSLQYISNRLLLFFSDTKGKANTNTKNTPCNYCHLVRGQFEMVQMVVPGKHSDPRCVDIDSIN